MLHGLALAKLTRLELRRSLGGGRAVLTLVVLTLVLAVDWSPGDELLAGQEPAAAARGLLRQGAWTLCLFVLLPALVHRAAATAERWHGGDGDWLGARPTTRWTALGGGALGTLGAGAILLVLAVLVIEFQAGAGGTPGRARVGRHNLDSTTLLRPWVQPSEVELGSLAEEAQPGDELRLRVALTLAGAAFGPEEDQHGRRPSGPSATLLWRVARGEEATTATATLNARAWLPIEIPPGTGPLTNRLINRGPGVVALLHPGSLELWRRGPPEATASLRIAAHALVLLTFAAAIALGLGFWMNAVTATLLTGAGLLWAYAMQSRFEVPGDGLYEALGILGEGRLPEYPGGLEVVMALVGALCGTALARAGARSWRHAR